MRARWIALLLCMAGCPKPAPPPPPNGGSQAGSDGGQGALVVPTVPPALAVPAGPTLTFVAAARGVQIYDCAAAQGAPPAWTLHAPRADLLDPSGAMVGSHFGGVDRGLPPGPYWDAKDGSRVHGANPVSVPNPGSIPLLRLEAADTSGTGVFSKVAFIQRLDTTGGAAPAGACALGKQLEVPYTANYYFYSKP
ncbi:MAG TPA: DUF3455 domain-containing protein [Kofleriaceae bacterium]